MPEFNEFCEDLNRLVTHFIDFILVLIIVVDAPLVLNLYQKNQAGYRTVYF